MFWRNCRKITAFRKFLYALNYRDQKFSHIFLFSRSASIKMKRYNFSNFGVNVGFKRVESPRLTVSRKCVFHPTTKAIHRYILKMKAKDTKEAFIIRKNNESCGSEVCSRNSIQKGP